MNSSDKENAPANADMRKSVKKPKIYPDIVLIDESDDDGIAVAKSKVYPFIKSTADSDSDFEDSHRTPAKKVFVKKMPLVVVASKEKENEPIGTLKSPKNSKAAEPVISGDSQPIVKRKTLKRGLRIRLLISDESETDNANDDRESDSDNASSYTIERDSDGSSSDESSTTDEKSADEETVADVKPVVLAFDEKKSEMIAIHPKIARKLFDHQIEGVQFMFNCCFNDLNFKRKTRRQDHGCILAHCMGLGKTLQLIALMHTAISYEQLSTNRILILCPKSTILNWKSEVEKWLRAVKDSRNVRIYMFPDASSIHQKMDILDRWSRSSTANDDAGILLLNYEAFARLVYYNAKNKNMNDADVIRGKIREILLKPGADLVVLDEGHKIKNLKSKSSQAVNQIWTKRRVILTGTPMQNNLAEYYSMVNFIKPNFLGTERDFKESYAGPIEAGQHRDSSRLEVRVMKERSFILHKKLSKFVQRRDVAILKKFLPPKFEFDICVPMSPIQNELYEYYLKENPLKDGKRLLPDFHVFRKIWTHPKVLETAYIAAVAAKKKADAVREAAKNGATSKSSKKTVTKHADFDVVDSEPELNLNDEEPVLKMSSPLHDWWMSRVTDEQRNSILSGNKMKILFEILNTCEQQKEKCLIFSEFTSVLDVVEMIMKQITEQRDAFEGLVTNGGKWMPAWDYCRLDGSTKQSDRQNMINRFNDPKDKRLRAFLISSKAGGQGINLVAATRCVLLDTSWNPSNDQQCIFRVFRMGQTKSCYIYRLLAMGTMEEKIYSRSVTKQATSFRVVDKQQVERHYNMAELVELYKLTIPDLAQRLVPNIPKDEVLAHLLHKCPETIYSYHEHDSLLSHEEDLTEEEKEAAWREYEAKAKVYEARLQQQQSQETPAFLESEPSFNENDEYLDRFNGNDVNKPSTVDDNRASLQPQSAVGSVASSPWMSTQQKAGPTHTATTGAFQSNGGTQKRKMAQLDIGNSLLSMPAKRPKTMQSTSNANQPATQAHHNGWLSSQAQSSRPVTFNQKFPDGETIILDD